MKKKKSIVDKYSRGTSFNGSEWTHEFRDGRFHIVENGGIPKRMKVVMSALVRHDRLTIPGLIETNPSKNYTRADLQQPLHRLMRLGLVEKVMQDERVYYKLAAGAQNRWSKVTPVFMGKNK